MIAFTNATLIDGTGRKPLGGATVVVEGSSIRAVGTDVGVPQGAAVVDLSGRWLVPGFIDAHLHLGGSPELNDHAGNHGRHFTWEYSYNIDRLLAHGITAVRSGGDWVPDIIEFRDGIESGDIRGPHIVAPGRFIQAFEGHPAYTVYMGDAEVIKNSCIMIHTGDGEERIRPMIDRVVEDGSDLVKVFCCDDNKTAYPSDGFHVPRIEDEQLACIVRIAHEEGLRVMCHIDDFDDMRRAVEAGVDTIEHVLNVCADPDSRVGDDLIASMRERGVCIVPTVIATLAHEEHGMNNGAPSVVEGAYDAVRRLYGAGVTMGVGTDAGIPFVDFGDSLHDEMAQLVRAGLTPLQVLTAATGTNAKILQRDDRYGTVEEGKEADLVVLGADPLADIANTRSIQLVMRAGRVAVDNGVLSA